MLTEASQMLSGMSRGAGLVLAAKNEVALKHIEFIQLEPTKVEDDFIAPATAPASAPPPAPKGGKPKPAPGGGKPRPGA